MRNFYTIVGSLSVSLLLGLSGPASAMMPHLSSTSPAGAQRGTEVDVTFHGERLSDAQELVWYSPGFQVLKFDAGTNHANTVIARIKIAPDCRLGEHSLRIRCASGFSDLRTFWVGPYPTVADTAPNTEFDKPQTIPLNVTVEGRVENEQVHNYLVEAKKGQRIAVEAEGIRLGRAMFDPFATILNSKRFALVFSDDTALLLQDPTCAAIAPEDGNYVVQIRETSYGGNGNCHFRLHVGSFPRPTGVFPAGGKAGETVTVKFLGDVGGEFTQTVKLPDAPQDKFPVFAERDGQIAPSPNWLRVSPFPNVLQAAPNNDQAHATPSEIEVPFAFNGIASMDGAADWYRFKAKKDQVIEINVFARRLRSPLDSVLKIFDAKGNQLAENDDAAGADSYLRFTAPGEGEFFLRITDHLGKGGPDYFYRIELAPVQPRLALSIPDVSRNNAQERKSIVVPRGNRFATLVQAKRDNFGGDLVIEAPDLPSGVTYRCENMAAGQTLVPVVFEATADAPIAGKLCDLVAKHADPKQNVSGHIDQTFVLVRGEPNDTMYFGVVVDKIAAAVVEEVPFKINIVEPKVPLVCNGTMDLKITAERKPGFDEPITVHMLFNPPGVGSANEVTIPKGETTALYRLNANGDAAQRTWKIATIAHATVNGAQAWVSSQLAQLTVAEPFVQMKIEMASAEQGQPTRVIGTLDQKVPFDGKAKVQLFGLPTGVTTSEAEITKDDKQVVFNITTAPTAPTGQHKSLFCSIVVMKDGEPITHSVGGGGVLRIDAPKKIEVASAKPAEKPAAPPPPPPPPTEKPLTRLEKLRLEQAEKEKMSQGK